MQNGTFICKMLQILLKSNLDVLRAVAAGVAVEEEQPRVHRAGKRLHGDLRPL